MAPRSPKSAKRRVTRVIIAFRDEFFRQGFRLIIEQDPSFEVAGVARTKQEALDLIRNSSPKGAIIEGTLLDIDGVVLTKQILSEFPKINIVLFEFGDRPIPKRTARSAGAKAVANFPLSGKGGWLSSLLGVLKGKLSFPSSLIWKSEFTSAELKVLRLMASQATVEEIAASLKISVEKVTAYQARIKKKIIGPDAARPYCTCGPPKGLTREID